MLLNNVTSYFIYTLTSMARTIIKKVRSIKNEKKIMS